MFKEYLYRRFSIKEHNSRLRTEVLSGVTDYFTIIYVVMLVPEIIMNSFPGATDSSGDLIGNFVLSNSLTVNEMLIALTAAAFLAAGVGSIVFGLLINVPFIQGPSLTIGTFVAYTICRGFGFSFNQALAIVFLSGICFFILSVFGIEEKIHKAIPKNIKYSVSAGIGMFIAVSGLQKAHIINYHGINNVNIFDISNITDKYTIEAILTICGVIFITILLKKHVHGAIFIGKIVCIIAAIPLGLIKSVNYDSFGYSLNIEKVAFKMDFAGLVDFSSPGSILKTVPIVVILIFSICIIDVFETVSMLIATDSFAQASNEDFAEKRISQILQIDSVTTSIGSTIGATSVSTYIESTAGVIEGGRTGLTAVITGILFLITVFISPFVSLIPSAATATTLIMAGVIMMNIMKYINFEDSAEAVPAFFTMMLMPLTGSLLVGICIGIISYVAIHFFLGKRYKVNKVLYVLAVLFIVVLFMLPK